MRLRQEERGIALVLALGMMVVLAVSVTAVIDYTSSNSRASSLSHQQQDAKDLAEAGLNAAYSVLNYWDTSTGTGNNPSDATLLGCNAAGTVCTPKCVSVDGTCPNASATGIAGTASYTGVYNSGTAVWTITGVGYARNTNGSGIVKKSMTATSSIYADPNQPANVAAWNHIYSTAPQGAGCEFNVTNNNVYIDVPVYVTGDMCLSGSSDRVWEQSGGQPVDMRVVGKLVIANGSSVGWKDNNNNIHKITSAAVGLGCAVNTTNAPTPCNPANYNYWVNSSSTSVTALTPPVADGATWYQNSDPGPKHPCKAGTTPAPFANSVLDNDTTYNNSVPTTFNLTPSYSYSCQSQNGTGQISWDDSNNILTVSGTIFIDGSVTVTQSGTYSGLASLYVGGTFSFTGSGTALCAVQYCGFSSWNPNTTMLMVVALGPGTAVNLQGDFDVFQGSLFTNPASTIAFNGNSAWMQGPLVGGKFTFNQWTIIQPLPTINKLPPGAPLAVNARAVPQSPQVTSG